MIEMAKALRVRREEFAAAADRIWEQTMSALITASVDAGLDPAEAAEELEFYSTLRESFEFRTSQVNNQK